MVSFGIEGGKFLHILGTELRLTWRRPSFWVSQGLLLLPMIVSLLSNAPVAVNLNVIAGGQLLILWLFLLSMVVGPSITRDLGVTGELLWTKPVGAAMHLLGVYCGLWIAQMPFLVVQVAFRWIVASLKGWPGTILLWTYCLPLLIVAITVGLLLVSGLGLAIKRTLPLIIVNSVVWFAFFQLTAPSAARNLSFLSLFSVVTQQMRPSASIGVDLYAPLVKSLLLVAVGAILVLWVALVVIACSVDTRRMVRGWVMLSMLTLVGLALARTGSVALSGAIQDLQIPVAPLDIQQGQWTVRAHNLHAMVVLEEGTITGESKLVLKPAQAGSGSAPESVVLQLNPGIELTSATDQSGAALETTRQGEGVTVHLRAPAGSEVDLRMQWRGQPTIPYASFSNQNGYSPPVGSLVTPDATYLLRDGDWYPWPWNAGPHITPDPKETEVTLQVEGLPAGGVILTPDATSLHGSTLSWRGGLPTMPLVIPPRSPVTSQGNTIYAGTLSSEQTIKSLETYAVAAERIATSLDATQTPLTLVSLPYLPQDTWDGSLLVTRESYFPVLADQQEQTALESAASVWFTSHTPPQHRRFVPKGDAQLPPGGQSGQNGVKIEDNSSTSAPISWVETADGDNADAEFATAALSKWVALELKTGGLQNSDLDQLKGTPDARIYVPCIATLHGLVEKVGPGAALRLVGGTVSREGLSSMPQLFTTLSQVTKQPLLDQWHTLESQLGGE